MPWVLVPAKSDRSGLPNFLNVPFLNLQRQAKCRKDTGVAHGARNLRTHAYCMPQPESARVLVNASPGASMEKSYSMLIVDSSRLQ